MSVLATLISACWTASNDEDTPSTGPTNASSATGGSHSPGGREYERCHCEEERGSEGRQLTDEVHLRESLQEEIILGTELYFVRNILPEFWDRARDFLKIIFICCAKFSLESWFFVEGDKQMSCDESQRGISQ